MHKNGVLSKVIGIHSMSTLYDLEIVNVGGKHPKLTSNI